MNRKAHNKVNLIGNRYGKVVVIKEMESKNGNSMWLCKCDCGKEKVISGTNLKRGITKSCGCLHKETAKNQMLKHGLRKHPLYRIWSHIKSRCNNPADAKYKDYGGRGISLCSEWKNDFASFYEWSISNGYEQGLSIDRKNNDGNYEPSNCRWVDNTTQSNNRRNNHILEMDGLSLTIAEWSRRTGISEKTIETRLSRGWDTRRALTTPPIRKVG